MARVPNAEAVQVQPSAAVREFAERNYLTSGAMQFGMDAGALARVLAQVVGHGCPADDEQRILASVHIEELVLARACAYGDERAWEIFIARFRRTLHESAYKIAGNDSVARELADSLYAELYGVDAKGQTRTSKLLYYQGRGSLQGWLRVVVAQEYVNRYRSVKRESSLDEAVEEGAQFVAAQPERTIYDPRVEKAAAEELATLSAEERFLLAAYYLDRRTLAEIAKLQGVHESTISRKLERVAMVVRKRLRTRLMDAGMTAGQAEEAMEEVDVRDLQVKVRESLEQGRAAAAFYPEKSESEG